MTVSKRILRIGAFLSVVVFLTAAALSVSGSAAGADCRVIHPLDPPDLRFAGRCPNCGMSRVRWARTWTSFVNAEGRYSVCSLHCLADISRKSGHVPRHVQVALYLSPEVSVPAEKAVFVVGSRAKGTMTKVSKPAFETRKAAEDFAANCGGKPTTWLEAYGTALAGVGAENLAVADMRLKKGKIVDPRVRVDECVVCGMYPARYRRNRAQVKTLSGNTVHFCSNQCLFQYLKDPGRYGGKGAEPFMIWVTAYETQRWVGARTAYYVAGSAKLGPMGYEAFAFDTRAAAEAFCTENGGTVIAFSEMRIERILSSP